MAYLASMGRHMLDATPVIAPPDITVVTTALQLEYALTEGHQDIEIREHIDLTGTQEDTLHALIFSTTRSIRGNCVPGESGIDQLYTEFKLSGIPLRPLQPNQCLIITDIDLLDVSSAALWMDNLYIRTRDTTATAPDDASRVLLSVKGSSTVYMTHTVLQGDGEGTMLGMHVHSGGRAYLQASELSGLCGSTHKTAMLVESPVTTAAARKLQARDWPPAAPTAPGEEPPPAPGEDYAPEDPPPPPPPQDPPAPPPPPPPADPAPPPPPPPPPPAAPEKPAVAAPTPPAEPPAAAAPPPPPPPATPPAAAATPPAPEAPLATPPEVAPPAAVPLAAAPSAVTPTVAPVAPAVPPLPPGPPPYSSVNFHKVSMHANAGCLAMEGAGVAPPGAHSVIRGVEAMAFVQMSETNFTGNEAKYPLWSHNGAHMFSNGVKRPVAGGGAAFTHATPPRHAAKFLTAQDPWLLALQEALDTAGPGAFKPAPDYGVDPVSRAPMPPIAEPPVAGTGVTQTPVLPTTTTDRTDGAAEVLSEAPPFEPVGSESSGSSRGLSAGKAVGVVIAILLPLVLLALLGWYCLRARRRRQYGMSQGDAAATYAHQSQQLPYQ